MQNDITTIKQFAHDWRVKNADIKQQLTNDGSISENIWRKLGQDGLLGVQLDEQYGGCSLTTADMCALVEELAYLSPSLALSVVAHSNLCGQLINRFGSPHQKQLYLPKLCQGQIIGAIGISEDTAGSDALSMKTSIHPDGDHWRLNGHKMWITNGPIADIFVIYAKDHELRIKAVLVPKSAGIITDKPLEKFGMRQSPTCRISFNHIPIQSDQIIPGDGLSILKSGLHEERLVLSAIPIAIMRRCLDEMISYTLSRNQFGQALASKQIIQKHLSSCHVKLSSCRALLNESLKQKPCGISAASCYLHASECATQVANTCMDIFGGYGYMTESGIPELLADAKLFQTGGGTEIIRSLIIGHALTGIKAY